MAFSKEYLEKLDRVRACTRHEHIDRILHLSNVYTWKFLDMDEHPKLSEVFRSYDLMDRGQWGMQERYHFDCHMDLGTRNIFNGSDPLGSPHYVINDEAGTMNYFDQVLIEGNEYHEFAQDIPAFTWKMFNRKFPNLTIGQVVLGIINNLSDVEFMNYMVQKSYNEYNCVGVHDQNFAFMVMAPFEKFHKYYRGIKETSIDLRRNKAGLKEACDAIHEQQMMPALMARTKMDSSAYLADCFTGLLAHTTLSTKQWEEFYWPYLGTYLDTLEANGKTMLLYIEDEVLRFAEYFQKYKKGTITMILEKDDPIELRKALPNVCICGGMTPELLSHGTPEQCVDRVKYLADTLGDGWILSQDKMVSFRNDCRRENLLAISEYVQNFRW